MGPVAAYVKAGGAWLNTSYAFQVNGVNYPTLARRKPAGPLGLALNTLS